MERAPWLPMVLLLVGYRYWCAAPNDAVTGNPMRKLLKFGHTMTAIGFLGSIAVLWVFHQQLPAPGEALEIYSAQRQTMGSISSLVLMPSLLITLLFGLASMAAVPGFHSAPWAWGKLATTVLMLEGSLLGIHSPMKKEAELAASAVADNALVGELRCSLLLSSGHWSLSVRLPQRTSPWVYGGPVSAQRSVKRPEH